MKLAQVLILQSNTPPRLIQMYGGVNGTTVGTPPPPPTFTVSLLLLLLLLLVVVVAVVAVVVVTNFGDFSSWTCSQEQTSPRKDRDKEENDAMATTKKEQKKN